jgi:hypothetical protein
MAKSAALKKPTATKAPAAAKAAPVPVAAAEAGHNDKFGSGLDPKREAVFIREFQNIQDAETDMAEKKGAMSGIYKRLESAGFSKDHITFAKTLTKKNVAEVIADFTMKIAICRIMGHAAGRQLDMLDKDRTPIEDMAYGDGLAAGKLGKAPANPYGMETMAGQRWQQGMSDGNAFRNQALNEAINGPSADIIKGAGGEETSEVGGEEGDQGGEGEESGTAGDDLETDGSGGDADGEAETDAGSDDAGDEHDDWDAADPSRA